MNPARPRSQHLVPSGVMRVPEPRGVLGHIGHSIKGALSLSPEHGDKATSPSSLGLSLALGGAGVSFTLVHGDPASLRGPIWSWGPLCHPTLWGTAMGHPAAPR